MTGAIIAGILAYALARNPALALLLFAVLVLWLG
jgi:hypothetical protein